MRTSVAGLVAQAQPGTAGLQTWISNNIVPPVLILIATVVLFVDGRGDNAGVVLRGFGLVIGLVAVGIALTSDSPSCGLRSTDLLFPPLQIGGPPRAPVTLTRCQRSW